MELYRTHFRNPKEQITDKKPNLKLCSLHAGRVSSKIPEFFRLFLQVKSAVFVSNYLIFSTCHKNLGN